MILTDSELAYLGSQDLARLATVAPDGAPQNNPVGFHYNAELGVIDIYGFNMGASRKYRNIQGNPNVALVIDDRVGAGAAGVRCLEIRGTAEAISAQTPPQPHLSAEIIRIHPRRIISWNIDPVQLGLKARNIL
jgi:pyridoxamine 5'-phosphate oxidase family protein